MTSSLVLRELGTAAGIVAVVLGFDTLRRRESWLQPAFPVKGIGAQLIGGILLAVGFLMLWATWFA
jgi:multisubunit Na+/H+ antiporter MnhB subunit